MRRFICIIALAAALAPALQAGEAKVIKVLPQYLDTKGRNSLSPSLYERDAYQAHLRKNPDLRSALTFVVQWKAHGVHWDKMKIRVEIRGVASNTTEVETLEQPVRKTGWFSHWSRLQLDGKALEKLGQVSAWRVTLWEEGRQLGEKKSFLW